MKKKSSKTSHSSKKSKIKKRLQDEYKFRRIENKIDALLRSNKFFNLDRSILTSMTLLGFEIMKRIASSEYPFLGGAMITSALEKNLDLIFKNCNFENDVGVNELYLCQSDMGASDKIRKMDGESADFFIFLYRYGLFELASKKYSRGIFNISIIKNKIKFRYNNEKVIRVLAFERMILNSMKSFLLEQNIERMESKINPDFVQKINQLLNLWIKKKSFFPIDFYIPFDVVKEVVKESFAKILTYREIPNNWKFKDYSIEDFRTFWCYLDIKCSILSYLDAYFSEDPNYQLYFIQSKDDWIQEISSAIDLEINKVKRLIDDLSFTTEIRNLGARIQPFIPILKNKLALLPSLVSINYFEGNFLDLQCKINKKLYDNLSRGKEEIMIGELKSIFNEKGNLIFKDKIKIEKDGKVLSDLDLVIYDMKTKLLIHIELKWPLRPKSVLDLFQKNDEINKGISQCEIGAKFIKNNLQKFLNSHFKEIKPRDVKDVFSIRICRDNIGTTVDSSKNYPLLDYDIFKYTFSELKFEFDEIIEIAVKQQWLPQEGIDYKIDYYDFSIGDYQISLPGFECLIPEAILPFYFHRKFNKKGLGSL